jgi:hypothetical protein
MSAPLGGERWSPGAAAAPTVAPHVLHGRLQLPQVQQTQQHPEGRRFASEAQFCQPVCVWRRRDGLLALA